MRVWVGNAEVDTTGICVCVYTVGRGGGGGGGGGVWVKKTMFLALRIACLCNSSVYMVCDFFSSESITDHNTDVHELCTDHLLDLTRVKRK